MCKLLYGIITEYVCVAAGAAPCDYRPSSEPAGFEPVQQPSDQPPQRGRPAEETPDAQPGSQPAGGSPQRHRHAEGAPPHRPLRQPLHPHPRLPLQAGQAGEGQPGQEPHPHRAGTQPRVAHGDGEALPGQGERPV